MTRFDRVILWIVAVGLFFVASFWAVDRWVPLLVAHR